MSKETDVGRIGEALVTGLFRKHLSDVEWTNEEADKSKPFDIIVHGCQPKAYVEVKTWANGRKTLGTQFKRPSIKRKLDYVEERGRGQIYTVVVKLNRYGSELRYIPGLPSRFFDEFDALDGLIAHLVGIEEESDASTSDES
jgi:hypothetical protein